MQEFRFEAVLQRPTGTGTWTYLDLPLDLEAAFAVKGQVKIKGTVNGYPFRSSAMPRGDGSHYLVVNAAVRKAIGVTQGDTVHIVMTRDAEERRVDIPDDFQRALERRREAGRVFETLAYSYRKEFVEWIDAAKQDKTRQNRIEAALEKLVARVTPKGKTIPVKR